MNKDNLPGDALELLLMQPGANKEEMAQPDGGNVRLSIVISRFDLKKMKAWAKSHGRSPSAFASQILANRIESNLDLITKLAIMQSEELGIPVEDFWKSLDGDGDEE